VVLDDKVKQVGGLLFGAGVSSLPSKVW
jgi:hypothetical protein